MLPVITIANLPVDGSSLELTELLSAYGIYAQPVQVQKEFPLAPGTCLFQLHRKTDLRRVLELFGHIKYCGNTLVVKLCRQKAVAQFHAA